MPIVKQTLQRGAAGVGVIEGRWQLRADSPGNGVFAGNQRACPLDGGAAEFVEY
jgi:hypothetical protein